MLQHYLTDTTLAPHAFTFHLFQLCKKTLFCSSSVSPPREITYYSLHLVKYFPLFSVHKSLNQPSSLSLFFSGNLVERVFNNMIFIIYQFFNINIVSWKISNGVRHRGGGLCVFCWSAAGEWFWYTMKVLWILVLQLEVTDSNMVTTQHQCREMFISTCLPIM